VPLRIGFPQKRQANPEMHGKNTQRKDGLNKWGHWCPVKGVLIFEIMLFFIDKSRKRDVTDLNFLERQMLYCTDDIRSLYSLSNSRFDSSRDISAGSHTAQGAEIARKPPQNSADFERSSVREYCFA